MQEIECRLRQCETQGVEASAEIQAAARKVADENSKLRELLARHGVGDAIIDDHLQLSSTAGGKARSCRASGSTTVPVLENLLSIRKGCGAEKPTIVPPNLGLEELADATYDQILWDTYSQTSALLVSPGERPNDKPSPVNHVHMRLESNAQDEVVTQAKTSNCHAPSNFISQPNQQAPLSHEQRLQTPTARPNTNDMQSGQSETVAHILPLAQPEKTANDDPNLNSCVFAVAMITTMAGGDPNTVSAELGCQSGEDCDLDNQLILSVMDRYSGTNRL